MISPQQNNIVKVYNQIVKQRLSVAYHVVAGPSSLTTSGAQYRVINIV